MRPLPSQKSGFEAHTVAKILESGRIEAAPEGMRLRYFDRDWATCSDILNSSDTHRTLQTALLSFVHILTVWAAYPLTEVEQSLCVLKVYLVMSNKCACGKFGLRSVHSAAMPSKFRSNSCKITLEHTEVHADAP